MATDNCVEFCRTLGDDTRQRILRLLVRKEELNVSDIVEEFNVSQPTISHHLNVLKQFSLVTTRKDGKQVFYAIDRARVTECCGMLVAMLEGSDDRK
jgi:ArsR family transcriptional regulator